MWESSEHAAIFHKNGDKKNCSNNGGLQDYHSARGSKHRHPSLLRVASGQDVFAWTRSSASAGAINNPPLSVSLISPRGNLWQMTKSDGVPDKWLRLILAYYALTTARVRSQ